VHIMGSDGLLCLPYGWNLWKGDVLKGLVGITCRNWIFDASLKTESSISWKFPSGRRCLVTAGWAFKSHSSTDTAACLYIIYIRP
jgi:hypothetical protein